MTNFYAISSSFFLAYHYFKKCKNSTFKNRISQLSDNSVPA